MKCQSNITQYYDLVRKLVKFNPSLYNNYDAAAKFVLEQSDLDNQTKMQSLHSLAHVYKGLAKRQEGLFSAGKAEDIINSVHLITEGDPKAYVANAASIFDIKIKPAVTIDTINKRIKSLELKPVIVFEDLSGSNGIVDLFKSLVDTSSFKNADEKRGYVENFIHQLSLAINLNTKNQSYNDALISKVVNLLSGYLNESGYIALEDIAEMAKLDMLAINLYDGRFLEGFRDETSGTLYAYDADNNVFEVPEDAVLNITTVRKSDNLDVSDNADLVFTPDFFASAFRVRAINNEDQVSLEKTLGSVANPLGQIRIIAVRNNMGNRRVERIQQVAKSDSKYAGLANRKHETFENAAQRNKLASSSNEKVMTVTNNREDEQGFKIYGVLPDGTKFHIYTLNDHVFVGSDNTTELVDFTNDSHIEQVKKLAKKVTPAGIVEITNDELQQLKNSALKYKEFQDKIQDDVDAGFNDGNANVDITAAFFDHYAMGTHVSKTTITVDRLLEIDPASSITLTIVKKDGDTETEEMRAVPFMFVRDRAGIDKDGKKVYTSFFRPVAMLAENEFIKGPSGELMTFDDYVDKVLNISSPTSHVEDMFTANGIESNKSSSITGVALRFTPEGTMTGKFNIIEPMRPLSSVIEFSNYITLLNNIVNKIEDKDERAGKMLNFDKTQYTLKQSGNFPFYVNMAVNKNVAGEDDLFIEFRPKTKEFGFIDESIANKKAFSFKVNKNLIKDIAEIISGTGAKSFIRNVISENPSLAGYDLTKPEGITAFYNALDTLASQNNLGKHGQKLVNEVNKMREAFTKSLVESVVGKMTKDEDGKISIDFENSPMVKQVSTVERGSEFIDAFKKAFTFRTGFAPQFLLMQQDAVSTNIYPQVMFGQTVDPTVTNRRNSYYSNLKNYTHPYTRAPRLVIVSRDAVSTKSVGPSVEEKQAAENLKATAAQTEAPTPSIDPNDVINADDIPYMMVDNGVRFNQGTKLLSDIQSEVDFIKSILPQFNIEFSDLDELLKLCQLDGNVLGMYKDRIIHLNSKMLVGGVVYHEAFHGVFRNILNDKQRKALLESIYSNSNYASEFTEASLKEFAKKRNIQFDKVETKKLAAEEILAEKFRNFVVNKRESKDSLLQSFFNMLKRLINMFFSNAYAIDSTFERIASGYYTSAQIQTGMYEGKAAYELVPGIKTISINPNLNKVEIKNSALSSKEQNDIVNLVVSEILRDETNASFDDKVVKASKSVIDMFDLNGQMERLSKETTFVYGKFVPKYTEQELAATRQQYEPLFANVRFVLGGRIHGYNVPDLNLTQDSEHNNSIIPYSLRSPGGVVKDNTNGQESFEKMKQLIRKSYDEKTVESKVDKSDIDKGDIEEALNKLGQGTRANLDDAINDETAGDKFQDGSILEFNSMEEGLNAIVRKFFSTIRSDKTDKHTGIIIPRVVDAHSTFQALLKQMTNVDREDILEMIHRRAQQAIVDGFEEQGNDYMNVYNALRGYTNISSELDFVRNGQVYNMVLDSLYGTEIDLLMQTHILPEVISSGLSDQELLAQSKKDRKTRVTIKDSVLYQDMNDRRKKLIGDMVSHQQRYGKTDEYHKSVAVLLERIDKILHTSNHILNSTDQTAYLNSLVDKMHTAMTTIGIILPKSLLTLSIYGIDTLENKKSVNLNEDLKLFIADNRNFLDKKQYLEKKFFTDLKAILGRAIKGEKLSSMLEDEYSNDKNTKAFNSILRKASAYIIKYDPNHLPAMVRNAEGKPIYRFVKNFPVMLMMQTLRTKGLQTMLDEDPYYAKFFKTYMEGNPAFGQYLIDEANKLPKSDASKRLDLYFKNIDIAVFGGVRQSQGGVYKTGQTFKQMDAASLHLSSLFSFMDRDFVIEYDANSKEQSRITTFMRSYDQLESTNTHFLITGIYGEFANKNGLVKTKDGYVKAVDMLQQIVRQEYNRIKEAWETRESKKNNFDNRISNDLMLNYNAKYEKDDVSKANVDDPSLRAYNFTKIDDFFATKENSALNTALLEAAKNGLSFEDAMASTAPDFSEIKSLREKLNTYASEQFKSYLDKLEKLGVIQKVIKDLVELELDEITMTKQIVKDPITGEAIVIRDSEGNAESITFYVSTGGLIPDSMRIDLDKKVKVKSEYGTVDMIDETDYNGPTDYNLENLLADYFFNDWSNRIVFNDLFQGDPSMNVKDEKDRLKRLKKEVATGSNYTGTYRYAVINSIQGFIHDKYRTFGPYITEQDILNDFTIPSEEIRKEIHQGFIATKKGNKGYGEMRELMDGQSKSLLMHQMDMFETNGRMSEEIRNILIAKHYRSLTAAEIKILQENRVVLNPKKTVGADRNIYLKQSEDLFDRNFTSQLTAESLEYLDDVYDELDQLWNNIYNLRKQRQAADQAGNNTLSQELYKQIQVFVSDVHGYYEPIPGREYAHALLNSMEMFQIDQLGDTSSNKNAKLLPIDIFHPDNLLSRTSAGEFNVSTAGTEIHNGYVNLEFSSTALPGKFKFLQVETSGVADVAKIPVQRKVLLPADLDSLAEIIASRREAKGGQLTESETEKINDITDKLLTDYNNSLNEVTKSRLLYLTHIVRKNPGNIGDLFKVIRENLIAQNASANDIKMFETKEDGTPVFNTNMPQVKEALKFYLFAQYSKHVTDEKGSGGKFIHISDFGTKVMVDENNNVIKTEDYLNNREKYTNIRTRSLGVETKREFINGEYVDVHYVECIIPKPLFESKQHREFFIKNLEKLYGTRIPSEDKRSMIALKVVDYMDSSNLNGIMVPQFVHLLAGSDFDVDALYTQSKAYYRDTLGVYHLYGDYSNYETENTGKYMEFINFMTKRGEVRNLFKERIAYLRDQGPLKFSITENTKQLMKNLGFSEEQIEEYSEIDVTELRKRYKDLAVEIRNIEALREELRDEADNYIDDLEKSAIERKAKGKKAKVITLQEIQDRRKQRYDKVKEQTQKRRDAILERTDIRETLSLVQQFTFSALRMQAAMDVFEKMGLPLTQEQFASSEIFPNIVSPVHQNKHLDDVLKIMSNDIVFNNLYINEKSSFQFVKDIADKGFGLTVDNVAEKTNKYTSTALINAKSDFAGFKDGIGIAANTNKLVALSSWNRLRLKQSIWTFASSENVNNGLDAKQRVEFGVMNSKQERTIAIIGNILGMFTDGVKDPISSVLLMNPINTGVTLYMVGLGLDFDFSVGFNFIPEIRKAIQIVESKSNAIQTNINDEVEFLNNAVKDQIVDILKDEKRGPQIMQELVDAGLLADNSLIYDLKLNKKNLVIDFNAVKLDRDKLNNNTLSTADIGYLVTNRTNKPLSLEAQKVVLVSMYAEQAQQTWALRRAGAMINLLKKLNPDTEVFDRLRKDMTETLFSENSIFTDESVKKLLDNQLWKPLFEMSDMLEQDLANIIIERNPLFQPLRSAIDQLFQNKRKMGQVISGYMGIQSFVATYPGSRVSTNPVIQKMNEEADALLQRVFTADYWFTNDLPIKLAEMQDRYPSNLFLAKLVSEFRTKNGKDASTSEVTPGGELKFRFIRTVNAFDRTARNVIVHHAAMLAETIDGRNFLRELYYHELARVGFGFKENSFLFAIPAEFQIPVSKQMDNIMSLMNANNSEQLANKIKEYMGKDPLTTSDNYAYDIMNGLVRELGTAIVSEKGNPKLPYTKTIFLNGTDSISRSLGQLDEFEGTVGTEKKEKEERIKRSRILLGNVLGIEPSSIRGEFKPSALSLGNKFTINLNHETLGIDSFNATKESMTAIAKNFGIKRIDKGESFAYEFPFIIAASKGQFYMLRGVDSAIENTKSIGEALLKTIGNNLENKTNDALNTTGMKAEYVMFDPSLNFEYVSTQGFVQEEIDKFKNIIKSKATVEVKEESEDVPPPVSIEKEEGKDVVPVAPVVSPGPAASSEKTKSDLDRATSEQNEAADLLAMMGIGAELPAGKPVLTAEEKELVSIIQNRNFNPENLKRLYNASARTSSFDDWMITAITYINSKLNGGDTAENVLEKLKSCL